MKQLHNTQIGWQVLKRNLHRAKTPTVDKGYDWIKFRKHLKEKGVRPVIKHREFSSLEAAHNARIDDDAYHRRSVVESVFASYVAASTTRVYQRVRRNQHLAGFGAIE